MHHPARPSIALPALAMAGAILWGLIEALALWRSRWRDRRSFDARP